MAAMTSTRMRRCLEKTSRTSRPTCQASDPRVPLSSAIGICSVHTGWQGNTKPAGQLLDSRVAGLLLLLKSAPKLRPIFIRYKPDRLG